MATEPETFWNWQAQLYYGPAPDPLKKGLVPYLSAWWDGRQIPLITVSCVENMAKKSVTWLGLRKLIVMLYNIDKLSIWDILKTVGKSKSVVDSIRRKLGETGSCEAKIPPGRPRKTTESEDRWIANELKQDISIRANANLGIKMSRHTISRRLNEINLNNRIASTKLYIPAYLC